MSNMQESTVVLKASPHITSYRHFILPIWGNVLRLQKRDWVGSPSSSMTEGDVECFSEYMELWIHRMRIEGLRLWLSGILRIQVGLVSMENLNHQLSSCGFALHRDLEKNYIFRVMYSGCFVQLENGNYVIVLNLLKRVSRLGGRTQKFLMKCPAVLAPPNREYIQCDSDFIQVTREIPVDNWNKELDWSLALSGSLVVALEDSSLIQVNVEMHKPNITVQGRRDIILSPVQVFKSEGHFLPLKLVSGHYAYSMEATCPNVNQSSSEDTVLHVYKRRMGLTKRGGYQNETLSVSSVIVEQTDTFTWSETSDFVQLIIHTSHIQQKKSPCSEMLKSHLHLMRDDPQEANVTAHSPEGVTGKPEVPVSSNKEFTPSVAPETVSTASQTADEEISITSVQSQQLQTTEALSTSLSASTRCRTDGNAGVNRQLCKSLV
ncbi:uncharacterized protein LOC107681931 [Sinocyclocheilus anshuiensis]|uniref:uncharacterized protein LOC107681931 n=1 Tax=Sinocyclocheilus anshuiensis TaxID=1608454 RepID=UPI0007B7A9F5|nr:PREDICTED: uncharacterized protein LOC107681931 [Sinocyclocheilus anshuiensis]